MNVNPAPKIVELRRMHKGSATWYTPEQAVEIGGYWLSSSTDLGSQPNWPEGQAQKLQDAIRAADLAASGEIVSQQPYIGVLGIRPDLVSTWGLKGPTGETMKRMFRFNPDWLVWMDEEEYAAALEPWISQGFIELEHPFGDEGWRDYISDLRPGFPVPYYTMYDGSYGKFLYRQSYLTRVDIPAFRRWAIKQTVADYKYVKAQAGLIGVKYGEYENPQIFSATKWPHSLHPNAYPPGAYREGINDFIRDLAAQDPPILGIVNTITGGQVISLWDCYDPDVQDLLIGEMKLIL